MAFPESAFRAALYVAGALILAGPAAAQESSMVQKSLDQLEKRVDRIEAEMGALRKTAPSKPAPPRSDAAAAGFTARLDSLAARLARLEAMPAGQVSTAAGGAAAFAPASESALSPAASPAPAAPTTPAEPSAPAQSPDRDSIVVLIGEVRALIAALKSGDSAAPPVTKPPAPLYPVAPPPSPGAAPAIPVAPVAAAAQPGLALKGDVQIQGERKATSQSGRDNLDDFWGRLNFGAEYEAGDFQSKVNIRIFPEGFGFEPLTGATFDTSGQGSLKVQSQPSPRMVINHAWVRYVLGPVKLRLGRFETVETRSENFGNYVDLGPSGKYMSRPAAHNALEGTAPVAKGAVSAMLGTSDKRLNRGFLRLYGRYPVAAGVEATLGYRANLFDRYHYPDAEILQRYDAGLAAGLPGAWKAFAEAALLQTAGREDDFPVLLGIQHPAGKVFDLVALEGEWLNDRRAAGGNRAWLLNLHARKSAGRFKLDAGIYSDAADPDWDAFLIGIRITSSLR